MPQRPVHKGGSGSKAAAIALMAGSVILSVVVIELLLRSFPEVLPLEYAQAFPQPARGQVASALNLPVRERMVEVERDDGGPPLLVHAPGELRYSAAEGVDRELGAAELVQHDSEGFCNKQAVEEAEILAIGDSFVWCTAVESAAVWSARLGGRLDHTVTQIAMPGEGVYEYIQLLKTYGLKKNPKVVLLGYFEGNDLRNAREYWSWREDSTKRRASRQAQFVADMKSLMRNSGLGNSWAFSFLAVASWELMKDANVVPVVARYRLVSEEKVVPFNVRNISIDEVETARDLATGRISLDILRDAFLEFSRLAERENFVPIVVYLPSPHSAYRDKTVFEDPEVGEALRAFSLSQREYMRGLTQDLDLRFIDLTERLAAFDPSLANLLYFPANLHMTPRGHEAVAAIIARELSKDGKTIDRKLLRPRRSRPLPEQS